jgi:hypothetical protein
MAELLPVGPGRLLVRWLPSRAEIIAATLMALAAIVRLGFTAPLRGMNDASTM